MKLKSKPFFTFLFIVIIVGLGFYFHQEDVLIIPKINQGSIKGLKKGPPAIKNFSLSIPKIGIKAPVIPNVSSKKEKYLRALETGVAHFKNTALPGEGGNIVIYGHSAYYPDKPGNYKEIFRDLKDLKKSDLIEINFNSRRYFYEVKKILIVNPDDSQYLKETKKEILTLITCVPPGTTKYRLIIIAEPKKSN